MKNNRDSRLTSPTVQDTATPTCTHRGFTVHSYKSSNQNQVTKLVRPSALLIKESWNIFGDATEEKPRT